MHVNIINFYNDQNKLSTAIMASGVSKLLLHIFTYNLIFEIIGFAIIVSTQATAETDSNSTDSNSTDWRSWLPEELEKQMSPAAWVPNKTVEEAIGEFFSWATERTDFERTSTPTILNISYGAKPSQKLDVYGTELPEDAPILFFIHGGYWQWWNKDVSGISVSLFHKHGIKTVAFGYTLAPSVKIADIEEEVLSALELVIRMYPKSTQIVMAGHSAGAHLSSELLHLANLPKEIANRFAGMILFGGIYDLRPVVPVSINLGLKMSQEEAESLSPLLKPFNNAIYSDDMKVLVFVGGNDSPEFQRQSLAYFGKLAKRFTGTTHFCKYGSDNHFTIISKLTDGSSQSFNSPNCDVTKILAK